MDKNAVETIYRLVRYLSIPVTRTGIVKALPDAEHNNLLDISNALQKWNINNGAFNFEADQLSGDYCPFVVHLHDGIKEFSFAVVTKIDDRSVELSNEYWNKNSVPREKFNQLYKGTALLVEPSEESGEEHYRDRRRKEIAEAFRTPVIVLAVGMLLAGYFIPGKEISWTNSGSFFLNIVGSIVCILLVMQSIGRENSLTRALCSSDKSSGCSDILSSRASKIFPWLSWAEAGLFYFSGSTLVVLFYHGSPALIGLLGVLSLLSLPFVFYSFIYQAFVFKRLCVLCSTVQLVLVLEFVLFLSHGFAWPGPLTAPEAYGLVVSFLVPVAFWLFLKPLLLKASELKSANRTLARMKENDQLFKAELQKQRFYALPDEKFSFVIGNPRSSDVITMVANFYCDPCSRAHEAIERVLQSRKDLQIRIVFTNTEKNGDVAKHLLALYKKQDVGLITAALRDWYRQSPRNYARWAKKYPVHAQAGGDDVELEQQRSWCKAADIRYTPMVLVNGYALPENYLIEDLTYLV